MFFKENNPLSPEESKMRGRGGIKMYMADISNQSRTIWILFVLSPNC